MNNILLSESVKLKKPWIMAQNVNQSRLSSNNSNSRSFPKLRIWQVGVVGFGLIVAFRLSLHVWGPYTRMRDDVVWRVGVVRLQSWAVDVLDNPPHLGEHGPDNSISRLAIPQDILRIVGDGYAIVVPSTVEMEEHVLIKRGGAWYHYGLRIGRSSFVPTHIPGFHEIKLADGVWGMHN